VLVSTDPATKHPTIVVADSGAGMTEETLAHLFEPFMQGNRRSIAAREGSVWARSGPGAGQAP